MVKKLRKEGYQVGRYLVRKIMHRLRLKATQRRAYKVTTQRKHSDAVADNLLNMNFNPVSANQVWAGDVTYSGSNGEISTSAIPPVEHIVDTTAAGDSFNAGYLAAELAGASVTDAIAAGARLAANVIGASSPSSGISTSGRFMRSRYSAR